MNYKAKWQHENTKVLGIRYIKSNFARRFAMILCYVPVLFLLFAWTVFRAICWIIYAMFSSFMTLTESFYIHWNYHGDDDR